jgi:hypothetical protein
LTSGKYFLGILISKYFFDFSIREVDGVPALPWNQRMFDAVSARDVAFNSFSTDS